MSIWKKKTNSHQKPWGEIVDIQTPFGMSGKVIYMNKGQRNSLKYYKTLNQSLYCLSGKILVTAPMEYEFGDEIQPGKGATFIVEPGELILIECGDPYRIKALEDSTLIEVLQGMASPDSVMIEDDYGRI